MLIRTCLASLLIAIICLFPGNFPSYTTIWPGGIVYYEFEENVPEAIRADFYVAAAEWSAYTGLKFLSRQGQYNRIVVTFGDGGCFSTIGMGFGPQELELGPDCFYDSILHEIGHAIGLMHEHQRYDRDVHIEANLGCREDFTFEDYLNYGKVNLGMTYAWGPFDHESIMIYPEYSEEGCKVLKRRDRDLPRLTRSISMGDVRKVKFLYYWEVKKRTWFEKQQQRNWGT